MANVQFLQGNKASLPNSAPTTALLFTTDSGEIFKGQGSGKGLLSFGSVLYGFTNLDDLQAKVPQGITGKLYLCENATLYTFNNGVYSLVAGSAEITSFEASKVMYDNSTSGLVANNIQEATNEINTKVENNKTEITDVKGRVDVLETDNTQNKADIVDLQSKQGQVKSSTGDVLGFLDSKVDGTTIVVEGDKLVVKGLDGVIVGATEINHLTGVTSNVQTQFDALDSKINATSSGMVFGGVVASYADLANVTSPVNGTMIVVTADENNDGGRTSYIYNETTTTFELLGSFELAPNFIQLLDTPNAYVDGKYVKSTDSGLVFVDADYNDLANKPQSAVADIDSAVAKAHEHTFDEVVLNKLTDVDGELQYDGKSISSEIKWESFNI